MRKGAWASVLLVAVSGALASACACAASSSASSAGAQGWIPFASHGGIAGWQADSGRGVWVQGGDRSWYYATFKRPCVALSTTDNVGFISSFAGRAKQLGAVFVYGRGLCEFRSFTPSDGPPVNTVRAATPTPQLPANSTAAHEGSRSRS
jgi:hypothetical protein